MAGFIEIDDVGGMSMGTPSFDFIVERTRVLLGSIAPSLVAKVYTTLDEEGLDMIRLHELNADDFSQFVTSCAAAFNEANSELANSPNLGPQIELAIELWDELLARLKEDSRYRRPA